MKYFKSIISILPVTLSLILFTACSNSDTTEPEPPVDDTRKSISILADKTTAEANGTDVITLRVVDNLGEDLTESSFITNETTGTINRKGVNTFTYMENATLTFTARFEDYESKPVEVVFQNRKNYEFYKKRVAIFKMTGTWCVNCPGMASALKQLDSTMPDKFYEIALHASTSVASDPFHTNATAMFATAMGGLNAFPTSVFNLKSATATSNTSATSLRNALESELFDAATCAIKAETSYNIAEKSVTINARIKSDKGGAYELAYIIVRDGLVAEQVGGDSDYVHNNTAIVFSNNFLGSTDKVTLNAGEEYAAPTITMTSYMDIDPADTRVLVYALTANNEVNNIISLPIGESVDYEENKD